MSRLTRLWTRLRRSRLDTELARGVDPGRSQALACRASDLTSERTRRRLGRWIAAIRARAAERRYPFPTSQLEPDRDAVLAASGRLAQVQQLLASPAPVYARGVAVLEVLLTDGAGPVYAPAWRTELDDRLRWILDALEGADPPGSGLGARPWTSLGH